MLDAEDMVEWAEPGTDGREIDLLRITKSAAIEQQKQSAFLVGYVYDNDQDALIDFLVVHWATIVKGTALDKV